MIFVLDTNVLISATLGDGVCRNVFETAIRQGQLVHSNETFLELIETLEKPRLQRYLKSEDKIEFLSNLLLLSKSISATERITVCRDPKDNMFLSLAVAANADYIVSRDGDLLTLKAFRNIPIITVSHFLTLFV